MNSMWPKLDLDGNFLLPKEILENQAEEIESLTKGILYIEIKAIDIEDNPFSYQESTDFKFDFILKSKVLKNYEFKILSISHSLNVYPLYMEIAPEIISEIDENYESVYVECSEEEQFINWLEKILGSNTVKYSIQNLYRLSK